jgi:hypothetical protein
MEIYAAESNKVEDAILSAVSDDCNRITICKRTVTVIM